MSMDLRWLIDPNAAKENPRRARFGFFVAGVVAGAVVGFLRLGDHDPSKTLLAALVGGLVGLAVAFRVQGPEPVSRSHVFEFVLAALAVALVILGAVFDDVTVALSALPLLLIAGAVFAIKKRVTQ